MKTCCRCKGTFPIESFYVRSSSKGTRRGECRACWNEITIRNQQRVKRLCVEYKGGACNSCGYKKCIGALEFHHMDPSIKEFQLSSSARSAFNDRVKQELDKCILLCSNCHREQHCPIENW